GHRSPGIVIAHKLNMALNPPKSAKLGITEELQSREQQQAGQVGQLRKSLESKLLQEQGADAKQITAQNIDEPEHDENFPIRHIHDRITDQRKKPCNFEIWIKCFENNIVGHCQQPHD